ncbi:MAG TPA: hypothetical protein VGJ93_15405 [Desulfuromonadaceae bacterium]|jgi:hypothetical protein
MRITGVLIGLIMVIAFDARAEFYKYKDSSGALVITDKLENVPKKYRNQFKVVWDKDLEARDSLARRKAEARLIQEKQEQHQNQHKEIEKKPANDGKRVVITVDEETGQLTRTLE